MNWGLVHLEIKVTMSETTFTSSAISTPRSTLVSQLGDLSIASQFTHVLVAGITRYRSTLSFPPTSVSKFGLVQIGTDSNTHFVHGL